MTSSFQDSLLEVCAVLGKHSVQYLIVGGAVALHGYFRYSTNEAGQAAIKPDFDVWYNPDYGNYFRLLDALEELGLDVLRFMKEKTPKHRESFFKFNLPAFTLDFLPLSPGNDNFRESYKRCETLEFDGTIITVIAFDDLVNAKLKTGRPKDLEDIDRLQKLREDQDSSNATPIQFS